MKHSLLAVIFSLHGLLCLEAAPLGLPTLETAPPFSTEGWASSDPEALTVSEAGLEIRSPAAAFAWRDQRLGASAIQAEVHFGDAEAFFLGVRIQGDAPLSGYVLDVTRFGGVALIQLVNGADTVLTSTASPVDVQEAGLSLCLRLQGSRLQAWLWAQGEEIPPQPLLEAVIPEPVAHAEGRLAVGVRGGGATVRTLEMAGEPFRPSVLGLLPLKREPRFRLTWDSVPGQVYRIDASADRTNWSTRYLVSATEAQTQAVIPASFAAGTAPGMFFRVVWVAQVVPVEAAIDIIVPTAPRLALAWTSSDQRVYGFEWSQDLKTWSSYGSLAVAGAPGLTVTSTVLPLPESLTFREAGALYVRVVDLDEMGAFGVLPVDPQP